MTSRAAGTGGRARRLATVGLGLLGVLTTVAVTAPWLAPYDPTARVGTPFARPSAVHLLGTNDVGQDLLSELLVGARVSLAVGVTAALTATVVGACVGLVAGYSRGWVDTLLMRAVDVVLALPFLPLTIVVGAFLGPGIATQMLVIAAVMWAGPARELRSQVLSVRERDHIQALRAMGAPNAYVLLRHITPTVAPLLVPQFVLATKTAILLEASLSFLGLGDASAKSWGTMLFFAHSRSVFLTDAWLWWVLPAGAGIAAAVLGFALLGYAFEERAQPGLGRPLTPRRRAQGRRQGQGDPTPADDSVQEPAALAVEELTVVYRGAGEPLVAVRDASLVVPAGTAMGLVGASGSGKSTLVTAAAGLIRPPGEVLGGRVRLDGIDLNALTSRQLRRLRGNQVALVPQAAASALNPVLRIGDQLAEAIRLHQQISRQATRRRVGELLDTVGVGSARARDYPHQLSGGMRQRVVLAMALANDPALLIADEPTTGLDVLVQAELCDLLDRLRRKRGLTLLIVSHDIGVVLRLADRLAVMHDGCIIEQGSAAQVSTQPSQPYTRELLAAVPRLDGRVPLDTPSSHRRAR